jgi:DNA-binding transcriptional ArsR family regulator
MLAVVVATLSALFLGSALTGATATMPAAGASALGPLHSGAASAPKDAALVEALPAMGAGTSINGIPTALSPLSGAVAVTVPASTTGGVALPTASAVLGGSSAAVMIRPTGHASKAAPPSAPVASTTSYLYDATAYGATSWQSLAERATPAYADASVPMPLGPAGRTTQDPTLQKQGSDSAASTGVPIAYPVLGGAMSLPQKAAVAIGLTLLALAPLALYHRIRGNSTLDNATRKTIYDAVCATPGLGVQEIAHLAGVTYSTTSYHLDRLIEAGMVVMSGNGNRLRYYKNGGQISEEERRLLPILENAEVCRILEAILDRPYTYRAALAERLGVSTTTINWHLKRLLELGLVRETREGRSAHLFVDRQKVAMAIGGLSQKMPAMPDPARRLQDRMVIPLEPLAAATV